MNGTKTQMQLWDQGKILKRVVILRKAPKSTSSFRSETSRFRAKAASGKGGYVFQPQSFHNCSSIWRSSNDCDTCMLFVIQELS